MKVQIQSVKFDADQRLLEFVEHKMEKFDRFAEGAVSANVILKLDTDHEKGNKVATITLQMPRENLVAESRSKTFEESVDEALDALKRQIHRLKGKNEK
ncbi:MAG: ribosome-associated translation inhibitor RaiA [Alistipes sp.]